MTEPTEAPTPEAPTPATAPGLLGDEPSGGSGVPVDGGEGEPVEAGDPTPTPEQGSNEPVTYELTVPEGLDDDAAANVVEFAQSQGLTPEAAQAVLDRDAQVISDARDRNIEAFASEVESWEQAVRNDPDIGGSNLSATIRNAQAALDLWATPEFAEEIRQSPYGSHPGLVRMLAEIGAASAEPESVVNGDHTAAPTELETLKATFPNSPEMWGETRAPIA